MGLLTEDLAAVANSKNQWGYINLKGKVVIDYAYTFADLFSESMARVMKGSDMLYIDKSGKPIKE